MELMQAYKEIQIKKYDKQKYDKRKKETLDRMLESLSFPELSVSSNPFNRERSERLSWVNERNSEIVRNPVTPWYQQKVREISESMMGGYARHF